MFQRITLCSSRSSCSNTRQYIQSYHLMTRRGIISERFAVTRCMCVCVCNFYRDVSRIVLTEILASRTRKMKHVSAIKYPRVIDPRIERKLIKATRVSFNRRTRLRTLIFLPSFTRRMIYDAGESCVFRQLAFDTILLAFSAEKMDVARVYVRPFSRSIINSNTIACISISSVGSLSLSLPPPHTNTQTHACITKAAVCPTFPLLDREANA